MADEIKYSELINPDALPKFKRETKKVKLEVQRLEKSIVSLLAKSSKLAVQFATPKNVKEIKALNAAISDIDKQEKALITTRKEMQKLDKQIEKDRLAEIKLMKDREKAFDKFEKQEQKNIKTAQKLKKANLDNANAFKKLEKQVNSAQARFKRLSAQYGSTAKITLQAQKRFEVLDDRLRKINKSARDGRRDVGRYGLALQKVKGFLSGGLGALGLAGGITAVVSAIGNAIGIFSGFEKAGSNLEAILGATKGEMDLLKTSAKELGATTAFTATQVIELQTEFAKLGFSTAEIDNATESTLALASAAGTDLAEAAAVVGATLGGFGKDAKETARFTDVMAKSFSTSALDMEKFKESMKSAAPAARAVGLTVEKTTALLGTMANAGISGSKAGNNLKTSLINLNAAGLTLDEGLKKVANSSDKLGEATALVGKNAAASFLVLAEGVEVTSRLEEGLLGAEGAAQRMADVQLDNLAGDFTILGSAWEGFILGVEDGEGVFNKFLRVAVKATTGLLGFFTKQNTAIVKVVDSLKKEQNALFNLSRELLDVNIDSKRRNELLDELNVMYPDILSNIDRETLSYEELKDILFKTNDALATRLQIQEALVDAESAANRLAFRKEIFAKNEVAILKSAVDILARKHKQSEILAMSSEQIIKLAQKEAGFLDDINKLVNHGIFLQNLIISGEKELNKERGNSSVIITSLLSGNTKMQELSTKEIKNLLSTNVLLDDQLRLKAVLILRFRRLNKEKEDALALDEKLKNSDEGLAEIETDLIKIQQALLKIARETNASNEADQEKRNIRIAGIQDEIRRLRALGIEKEKNLKLDKKQGIDPSVVNSIDQELQARTLLDIERERIDNDAKGRFLQSSEFEKLSITEQFRLREEFFDKEVELIERETAAKRQAMEDETFFQNLLIEQKRDAEQEDIDNITKERLREEKKVSGVKGWTERKKEIFIEGEAEKRKAKERSDDEILLNETQLQNALKELDNGRVSSYQTSEEARVAANKEANDAIAAAEKEANEKRKADNIKMFNDIVSKTQEALNRINKEKADAIDAEIAEARESVKVQQGIAAAGGDNILAEEKARLAKLGLERKRELERQALQERRIALAQNFVNSLAAHSKDDPKGAFAKAAFETFAGEAFAKLIAGFYDGTEDTGTVSKPLDTKGGRLAVLHNNERVMTAKQNAMVGSMTNPELADLAYNYQNGDLSPSHFKQLEIGNMMQQPSASVDMSPVIAEMRELKAAFEKGQVSYNVDWNSNSEAVERITQNNVAKIIRHKKPRL